MDWGGQYRGLSNSSPSAQWEGGWGIEHWAISGNTWSRRVLLVIPLLIGLTIVMFALIHLAPGDPVRAFISEPNADPASSSRHATISASISRCPCSTRKYLGRLVRGDLGTAYTFNSKPVL